MYIERERERIDFCVSLLFFDRVSHSVIHSLLVNVVVHCFHFSVVVAFSVFVVYTHTHTPLLFELTMREGMCGVSDV